MDIQFPVRKKEGGRYTAKGLMDLLKQEMTGHYLLGRHRFWHGGIHFTDATLPDCIKDNPIHCIADGKIIAYRLNENYKTSTLKDTSYQFSTSFCLVKHEYTSPKEPSRLPKKPEDWKGKTVKFETSRNVRNPSATTDTDSCTYSALFETGGKIKILEVHDKGYVTGEIISLANNATELANKKANSQPVKKKVGDEVYFLAFDGDNVVEAASGKPIFVDATPPPANAEQKPKTNNLTFYSLYMHLAPHSEYQLSQGSTKTYLQTKETCTSRTEAGIQSKRNGSIPVGTIFEIEGPTVNADGYDWAKGYRADTEGNRTQEEAEWFAKSKLKPAHDYAKPFTPQPKRQKPAFWQEDNLVFDQVKTCDIAIKAGEPLGYLGLYETPTTPSGGKKTKYQLHFEIFSNDTARINDFLNNKAKLTIGQQHLGISSGSLIYPGDKPPNASPPPLTGVSLSLNHAVPLKESPLEKNAEGKEWYKVKVYEQSQFITGWVDKEKTQPLCQHDWRKIGFMALEEQDSASSGFAGDGFFDPEAVQTKAKEDSAPTGFFKKLFVEIDKNNNGEIDDDEAKAALNDEYLANRLSHIIGYHPTEWKEKSSHPKWNKIKDILKNTKDLLKHEQNRIDELVFWDEVPELSASPSVYHFHPVAFVENIRHPEIIDVEEFVNECIKQHTSFIDATPSLNEISKNNLREVTKFINLFYAEHSDYHPNLYWISYMYATARLEAYDWNNQNYFSSRPESGTESYFNKYDPVLASTQSLKDRAIKMENTAQGDGFKYRGRGLVQLTWKMNYRKAKDFLGVDFVNSQDKALEYRYAVPIMIWGMVNGIFTTKKLSQYINSHSIDYNNARRIINGYEASVANTIEDHAKKYQSILEKTSGAPKDFR